MIFFFDIPAKYSCHMDNNDFDSYRNEMEEPLCKFIMSFLPHLNNNKRSRVGFLCGMKVFFNSTQLIRTMFRNVKRIQIRYLL